MPSKELLYSVLPLMLEGRACGINFIKVENVYRHENLIHFFIYKNENERLGCSINIYELAHKCKEWALSKGYHIESVLYDDNQDRKYTSAIARVRYSDYNSNYTEVFACDADTETEAIFKACEWIMEYTR